MAESIPSQESQNIPAPVVKKSGFFGWFKKPEPTSSASSILQSVVVPDIQTKPDTPSFRDALTNQTGQTLSQALNVAETQRESVPPTEEVQGVEPLTHPKAIGLAQSFKDAQSQGEFIKSQRQAEFAQNEERRTNEAQQKEAIRQSLLATIMTKPEEKVTLPPEELDVPKATEVPTAQFFSDLQNNTEEKKVWLAEQNRPAAIQAGNERSASLARQLIERGKREEQQRLEAENHTKQFAAELLAKFDNRQQELAGVNVAVPEPSMGKQDVAPTPTVDNPVIDIQSRLKTRTELPIKGIRRILAGTGLAASILLATGIVKPIENSPVHPQPVLGASLAQSMPEAPVSQDRFGNNLSFSAPTHINETTNLDGVDQAANVGVLATSVNNENIVPKVAEFVPPVIESPATSHAVIEKGKQFLDRFQTRVKNHTRHFSFTPRTRKPESGSTLGAMTYEKFVKQPLTIPQDGSFEGVIESLYGSSVGKVNFPEQPGLYADAVYRLAVAHNPENASLSNINPGKLNKTIEELVGEKGLRELYRLANAGSLEQVQAEFPSYEKIIANGDK